MWPGGDVAQLAACALLKLCIGNDVAADRRILLFYNARANPDALLGGQPFKARIVEEEAERFRLWSLADRVFPAFAAYRDSAAASGRTIPILQLAPSQRLDTRRCAARPRLCRSRSRHGEPAMR